MSAHIYHGPWINWSHGLIRGATVTLGEREGGLLTAFIATFVTIVGAELWKIICYILHQARSTSRPQDGLYHQQQVILRTSPTPGGAAWLFLRQTWSWAGKARLAVLRTLPWSVFSVAYIFAIGIIAVFSSEISKNPGPQRLIIALDACGTWALNMSSPDVLDAYETKTLNDSIVAATYARACYGDSNDPLQCGKLPVPALKYKVDRNATCPFQSGICYYGDTAAISMTTDMLDSHLDLGINARENHRMQVEKSTTCAPLRRTEYASIVNVTEGNGLGIVGDKVVLYNYGSRVLNDGTRTNYTHYYNIHAGLDQFGYSLSAYSAIAGANQGAGTLTLVPAINTTHADLSLLFVSANSIYYQQPVDDPVFGAHDYINALSFGTNVSIYSADQYVSVIGCSEQYRACNPLNNVCTPRLGFGQLQEALVANKDGMQLNDVQNATFNRLLASLQLSSVFYATYTQGGSALRANEVVSQLSSGYLPPNQWHIEVSSWFDAGLARIQQKVQEYATGPASIDSGSYVHHPNPSLPVDAPWVNFCYSQLVNDSSDTMSFSVLGLVLLLGLGGVIIFVSLTIDTVVGYLQYKTGRGLHARMEWLANDRLQMQRLLFQEMKLGRWSEDPGEKVPTTMVRNDRFVGVADRHVDVAMKGDRAGEEDGAGVHFIQEYGPGKAY